MEVYASRQEEQEATAPTLSGPNSLAPTAPHAFAATNTTGPVKSPLLPLLLEHSSTSTLDLNAEAREGTALTQEDQEAHAPMLPGPTMSATIRLSASELTSTFGPVLSPPRPRPPSLAPPPPPSLLRTLHSLAAPPPLSRPLSSILTLQPQLALSSLSRALALTIVTRLAQLWSW